MDTSGQRLADAPIPNRGTGANGWLVVSVWSPLGVSPISVLSEGSELALGPWDCNQNRHDWTGGDPLYCSRRLL